MFFSNYTCLPGNSFPTFGPLSAIPENYFSRTGQFPTIDVLDNQFAQLIQDFQSFIQQG